MKKIHHKKSSLPIANKSRHCSKVKCHRSLQYNHPISYTNGLCERHFFSIDLSSSDDDDDSIDLINEPKLSSEKKQIYSIKNQFQPLRGDIRNTREIFDGHQWSITEQTIDSISSTIDTNEENLLKLFRLLTNYQIIQDELKKQSNN